MPFTTLSRGALWSLLIMLLTFGTVQADPIAEVERILDDIRQDRPVPRLDYLHPVAPMNPGCALFEGQSGTVTLQVETHPDSLRVASLLLQIPGPDQTRALLSTVSRVLGPPHSQDRYQSSYSWDWPEYRAASLHYAPGGSGAPDQTIVSLFYR